MTLSKVFFPNEREKHRIIRSTCGVRVIFKEGNH
jgi:hypothetical protein